MIRDQLHIDEQGIGWRIVQAVSFEAAEQAIAQAKVSGSVAHTEYDGDNRVPVAEVKRDVPICTCSQAIGMRHSPHCPIFAYEVANDERAGRLPPRSKLVTPVGRIVFDPIKPLTDEEKRQRVQKFTLSIQLRPYQQEAIAQMRKFWREITGQQPAPLSHNYPQWETDEFGEDKEQWRGRMRIVRNRKRIRKLKKRGVPMMDLRAFTARGYVGKREAAWFVSENNPTKRMKPYKLVDVVHDERIYELTKPVLHPTGFGKSGFVVLDEAHHVPAGTKAKSVT